MKIVSLHKSGLGNQLFQFAAGRYYAKRYGATLEMTKDPPAAVTSHGYPRPFLLSHFQIDARFREPRLADRIALNDRPVLRPLMSAARRAAGIAMCRESLEQRYRFMPELPFAGKPWLVYLVGYWQVHGIADSIADQLRPELELRQPATGKNLDVLEQIGACRTPVSLHVRRGDYTLAVEGNIALPLSFYERAVAHMLARLDDPTFFVFSDDIAFARANLPRSIRTIFVDHNQDATAHEDLRLMAACHHHIIANSSFSWWGAWLNARPEKVVCAPKYWHLRPESYYPDLFPPEWHLEPV